VLGRGHCLSSCDNVALSGPAGYVESGWPSQVCRTWLAVTLAQGRLGVSNLLAQSTPAAQGWGAGVGWLDLGVWGQMDLCGEGVRSVFFEVFKIPTVNLSLAFVVSRQNQDVSGARV